MPTLPITGKQEFVRALAEFLAGNQARKSLELQMGKESAKEWAKLFSISNLQGYCTVAEAEKHLTKLLK